MHHQDKKTVGGSSLLDWFSPVIKPVDQFVQPNFTYGQFFYTAHTAARLVTALDHYRQPCCLCTPRLAKEWLQRGRTVDVLDCDSRFDVLPGYRVFDLLKPARIEKPYDCVIFDPVFLPAATLCKAVDAVISEPTQTDLFITFPVQRSAELINAFQYYGLRQLSFELAYCNVKDDFQHEFRLFGTKDLEIN